MHLFWKIATGAIFIILASAGIVAYRIHREFKKIESDDPTVWEPAIEEFEEEDKEDPPPANATLFIGSSSIRFWKSLKKDMHPLPVINRGFGGAKLRDIIHYAERIILPYHLSAIVLFAGTNDISGRHNDKTPEKVAADFKELMQFIEARLPHCKVYYLPITPTSTRWNIWPSAERANLLIEQYIMTRPNLYFIPTSHLFLTHGKPNEDLLWWDGVHLNKKGYRVWIREIRNALKISTDTGVIQRG